MTRDTRADIAEYLMDFVDSARTLRELREAEAFLEELAAKHGPYDLVVGAVEEISRRILYMECGQGEDEMKETFGIVQEQVQPGSAAHEVERLIERTLASPRTLVGPRQDGTYAVPCEDEVRRHAGHAMRSGEQVVEFFARTGLSLAQMRTMTKREISEFVERADRNNLESGVREPRTNWLQGPTPPQPRFAIVG